MAADDADDRHDDQKFDEREAFGVCWSALFLDALRRGKGLLEVFRATGYRLRINAAQCAIVGRFITNGCAVAFR